VEVLEHIVLMFARYSILVQFCSCTLFPVLFLLFYVIRDLVLTEGTIFVVHKHYDENTVQNVNAIYPDVNNKKKS